MGFLDDVKKGASSLSDSINSSVKGTQAKHQASSLLHDLGVLTWRSRTGQPGADDAAELARIEGELADLVAAGSEVDLTLKTAAPPPPPPPAPAAPADAASAAPPPAATPPPAPTPPAPPAADAAAPPPPAPPAPAPAAEAPAPPAPAPPAQPAEAPAPGGFTLDDL
ncbi:MAG: hypothetical protein ACXV95_02790 [Acidimicrobiales bacterium]